MPQPLVTGAKKPKKAPAAVAPAAAPAAAAPQPLVSGGKPKTKLQKEAAKLRAETRARAQWRFQLHWATDVASTPAISAVHASAFLLDEEAVRVVLSAAPLAVRLRDAR